MSPKPIVLNPDLQRLQLEGYEVEVRNGHLLVHSIPYVNAQGKILRGIMVTDLNGNVGSLGKPSDHQVWFVGEYPCHRTGQPIETIRHTSENFKLWPGFVATHRFSNKPFGENGYPDYYSKMKNYISIIANEAKAIDEKITPCTFKLCSSSEEESAFQYWDTASSRAHITCATEKLAMDKVGIVGLGGTGSYVLDLITKTPIREIHLYDEDTFVQHNAFRAPGAASKESLEEQLAKVTYFSEIYSAMHRNIIPHKQFVTESNIAELKGLKFVFLCVDKGAVRKLVSNFLQEQSIPFVDVGMDLSMIQEENSLIGSCRVTLSTSENSDHFDKRAPQGTDNEFDLYQTNIQVADMNALNAALAVIKWKQLCGFYQDVVKAHHTTYSINSHSLTRDEMIGGIDANQ